MKLTLEEYVKYRLDPKLVKVEKAITRGDSIDFKVDTYYMLAELSRVIGTVAVTLSEQKTHVIVEVE